jgi:hypothetical protein
MEIDLRRCGGPDGLIHGNESGAIPEIYQSWFVEFSRPRDRVFPADESFMCEIKDFDPSTNDDLDLLNR